MAIFQEDGYATFEEIGRIYLILICFGFGILPITYLLSMLFAIPSNGYVRVSLLNIVTGVAFFIVVFVLDALEKDTLANALNWIFSFMPHFGLCMSLTNLNTIENTKQACLLGWPSIEEACLSREECCLPGLFDWEQPGILRNLLFMLLSGCIGYGLLILIEMGMLQNVFYKGKTMYKGTVSSNIAEDNMDADVLKEKQRIDNASHGDISSMSLVLKNMTKYYKKFLAVNQISVGINHSECFGLLGVNGAGKTSTFKMLTGDELISSGEAWVKGISLKTNMNQVHQIIGYCPQFDALIEDLTGRETLRLFCLLRGIPNNKIKYVIETLAIELNFVKHIDKKIKEYSGGNKRKVSTAISLIGNPVVVYLDEPTTGMDPGAKRQLWDMICRIRNAGKTIVLTSHSMEECEALCTKLAIMVNGEFKCIGSSQYLKNKYSQGYLVTVKAHKAETSQQLVSTITEIKNFIMSTFPGAELREEYQGLLTYNVPSKDQKWSRMFGILQSNRQRYNIEDYSLSQTSLEQVFLSFTKYQREEHLTAPN
jgi:ATP-binding cassette subfamily A (ABC1) protein 3